jgi:hypothetical protein
MYPSPMRQMFMGLTILAAALGQSNLPSRRPDATFLLKGSGVPPKDLSVTGSLAATFDDVTFESMDGPREDAVPRALLEIQAGKLRPGQRISGEEMWPKNVAKSIQEAKRRVKEDVNRRVRAGEKIRDMNCSAWVVDFSVKESGAGRLFVHDARVQVDCRKR